MDKGVQSIGFGVGGLDGVQRGLVFGRVGDGWRSAEAWFGGEKWVK